ncbi:hypothetical protein EDD86DRAFT_74276 [Gorgonomyces haynaldii]|nr:hypothetical protein EDD86DRAFT_74276 [Gorgonomyces haynaldii]
MLELILLLVTIYLLYWHFEPFDPLPDTPFHLEEEAKQPDPLVQVYESDSDIESIDTVINDHEFIEYSPFGGLDIRFEDDEKAQEDIDRLKSESISLFAKKCLI